MPVRPPRLLLPLCALLLLPAGARARVGETQEAVERRLLQPGLGKLHREQPAPGGVRPASRPKGVSVEGGSREAAGRGRERQRQPFFSVIRPYLPQEVREVVYWKSAVARQLDAGNGWVVHVFYWNNRSVLEIYERNGGSLNEAEINGLLLLNRGNSNWVAKAAADASVAFDGDKPPPEGDPAPSLIGYDNELADRSLRMKTRGNWVCVYSTKFDVHLWKLDAAAKEERRREAEKRRQDEARKAPESLMGF